jgi:hypothetical protein
MMVATRHTCGAAALQTLDARPSDPALARRPVHADLTMVLKVYSHLGNVRHRSEHVEYGVNQHKKTSRAPLKVVACARGSALTQTPFGPQPHGTHKARNVSDVAGLLYLVPPG